MRELYYIINASYINPLHVMQYSRYSVIYCRKSLFIHVSITITGDHKLLVEHSRNYYIFGVTNERHCIHTFWAACTVWTKWPPFSRQHFLIIFLWMKYFWFPWKLHSNLFPRFQFVIARTCDKLLNQWWSCFRTYIGVTWQLRNFENAIFKQISLNQQLLS